MRTVLMIAYFFPPLGGIATQRALKFARYLPESGWRPVILSVQGSPYPLRDPELMGQIPPDVPVFRARSLESEHLYNLSRRLTPSRQKATRSNPSGRSSSTVPGRSLAARLEAWLCIPDGRVGWLPFAVPLGKQVLRGEKPSVIFSTSAPYTAHLIGKRLAEWSGLPWVLDLRDLWVNNHFHSPPTRVHRFLTERLESACVRRADRVVCVTPVMTEEMRCRYADQPGSKFVTITNGFDADDFNSNLAPDPRYFSIRHLGSLYGSRSAGPFLQGLVLALQREPKLKDCLQVEFIGAMDWVSHQSYEVFVSAHQLQAWVSRHSFVPHHEAIQLMQQSQVQLLILGESEHIEGVYTGKLFEYLGAGRPILAIAPPSIAATLVAELEAGIVADPGDHQSVAEAILKFYSWFQEGKLQCWSAKGVQAYERSHLAEKLASLMDALVTERPG